MLTRRTSSRVVAAVAALTLTPAAFGQHTFDRTRTVDPSGNADFTTIQAAINDITPDGDRWTVLIYAGEYNQNITLDGDDEGIDLVGVDAEAVIIKPTSSGAGVKITTDDVGVRNNRIANLTIITADGHGIEIVKGAAQGDQRPTDITIEGVTIDATGTTKNGVEAQEVDDLLIADCTITSAAGHGINLGKTGTGSTVFCEGIVVRNTTTIGNASNGRGMDTNRVDHVTAESSSFIGAESGIHLHSQHVDMSGCTLRGTAFAFEIIGNSQFLNLRACELIADRPFSGGAAPQSPVHAIRYDPTELRVTENGLVLIGCRIVGRDESPTGVETYWADQGIVTAVGCEIIAETTDEDAPCVGVISNNANAVLISSSITTTAPEQATHVYDLEPKGGDGDIYIVESRFSKWKGPVFSASGSRTAVQRVLNADAAADDAIRGDVTLTSTPQELAPTADPDVYRVLTVKGNTFGMNQDVIIIGTNWAGEEIAESIQLNGADEVIGEKAFRTVTTIVFPAQNGAGETVRVGTSDKLGLHAPLSASSDVIQWAKDVSSVWTIQSSTLTIDVDFATINPGTITTGDSFEFTYLTAR